MRCGKGNDEELALRFERRNPRECAVAKFEHITEPIGKSRRNPRECAVAKFEHITESIGKSRRNPRECAVAKLYVAAVRFMSSVATRANALWQRCAMVNRCRSGVVTTRANALW